MPSTDWLLELPDDDRQAAITGAFERVMATADGQVVFRMIAEVSGLFDPIMTEEERIRHNLGLELLQLAPKAVGRAMHALLQQQG